ncbi:MAG: carbonic anhydrase, partial [Thiotrichales bacterium]|nr:carbonic anhydrase [Thiotrichales bacterium]
WEKGQELAIHGFIYDIKDGRLHNMNVTIDNIEKAEKAVLRELC